MSKSPTEDEDLEVAERRERDRRTMEAIGRLYHEHAAEPPPLFDDTPSEPHQLDQLARYVEIMGRTPLHADKDRATLRQKPHRRGR